MKYDFLRIPTAVWLLLLIFSVVGAASVVLAQSSNTPTRRENLLNGLRVLIWAEPANPLVTIRLRVHSGAAFDTKDREGTMRLLADSFFTPEARVFFAEDLGGELKTEVTQDFIEITASGKAENFERVLDAVRAAVTAPNLSAENVRKVQAARLKELREKSADVAEIADAAVRKRLFGSFFPYGRSPGGTAESVAKIDRADLMLARERFLTADNATLAIIGKIDPKYAVRAVKQFLGNWNKADKPVPPTFRQPDAPAKDVLKIKVPTTETGEIRFAVRGAARNSADWAASEIAAEILQTRWRNALPAELKPKAFVRQETHVLPGIVIFGASVPGGFAEPYLPKTQEIFAQIFKQPITGDEFDTARKTVIDRLAAQNKSNAVAWFDADTFRLKNAPDANAATLTQTQAVLANWQRQTPAAAVVVVTQSEGNAPAN
jgi:hypothetical protein